MTRDVTITGTIVGTKGKKDLRAVIIVKEEGRPDFVHAVPVLNASEACDFLVATITAMKLCCELLGARVTLPNVKSHDYSSN
jgi:formyltetrahydrofolate synthetase